MSSLHQLSTEMQMAVAKLEESGLEPAVIADTLDGLSGELEVKATNVALYVLNLEANAAAIKEAEAKMAQRRKAIEHQVERMKEYIKTNMERVGIQKIECPQFRMMVKKNPPRVVVDAQNLIPGNYWTDPPPPESVVDKKAIADAIKSGVEVPGAHLEQATSLVIS